MQKTPTQITNPLSNTVLVCFFLICYYIHYQNQQDPLSVSSEYRGRKLHYSSVNQMLLILKIPGCAEFFQITQTSSPQKMPIQLKKPY